MAAYKVKEIYYTLQGEGLHTGRPAVFCRFSGCNLWSGREQDRASAICKFCDTDFFGMDGEGGGSYMSAQKLAMAVSDLWPNETKERAYVVCTGGEPALQLDDALVSAFHELEFEVAVETNGTLELPKGLDWVCVSPKSNAELKVVVGDELKLVYPQADCLPSQFEILDFKHFYLQPMDGPYLKENTIRAIEYCKDHAKWSLSVQSHKLLGLP